jgi:uncharacterized protein YceK
MKPGRCGVVALAAALTFSGCSMMFQAHLPDESIGGHRADATSCGPSRTVAWVDTGLVGVELAAAATSEIMHDHGGTLNGDTATAVTMIALTAAFIQGISALHGFVRADACRTAQSRAVTATR